jgi:hypothetical protein
MDGVVEVRSVEILVVVASKIKVGRWTIKKRSIK